MRIRAAAGTVPRLPERRRDVRRGVVAHHDPRSLPRPGVATHLRPDRRRWPLVALTPALMLLLALAVVEPAGGEVPTAVDVDACNDEAPRAVKAGAASADPQIRGIATEGANSAAYQAAYRSCMRRKGFWQRGFWRSVRLDT